MGGASTLVLDGSYASSNFRQETRGTIGAGEVIVADLDGGTPLSQVNRDIAAAQQVTKDSQTGFTDYVSESAIRETAALVTGDRQNSTILQGAEALASDPLAAARGLVEEVKSLGDGRPESGRLETLLDEMDSRLPGYAGREGREVGEQLVQTLGEDGFSDDVIEFVLAATSESGVLENEGRVQQILHSLNGELAIPSGRLQQFEATRKEFLAKGDYSPEAIEQLKQDVHEFQADIVVTGRKEKSLFDEAMALTVQIAEDIGRLYNRAPEPVKEAIEVGTLVLGGWRSIAASAAVAVSGSADDLEKLGEIVPVGTDALLRGDSFWQVLTENQDKSSTNHTHNQVTGFDLVLATLLPGVGKGGLKGKDGPDTKPDAPAPSHGGTSSGANPGSAKTVPDKAGEISADAPTAPNTAVPDGVSFGRNANQDYHVWCHVKDELGMSRQRVQDAVVADLPPVADLSSGLNVRFVNVDGVRLQYSAYKLPDGTVSIGRIHEAN